MAHCHVHALHQMNTILQERLQFRRNFWREQHINAILLLHIYIIH